MEANCTEPSPSVRLPCKHRQKILLSSGLQQSIVKTQNLFENEVTTILKTKHNSYGMSSSGAVHITFKERKKFALTGVLMHGLFEWNSTSKKC